MSFPGKTQVEVVEAKGKVKIVHISNVKYVLHVDRVISKLPNYQSFGRQSKLMIDPKDIPNLKWEPTVTVNSCFRLSLQSWTMLLQLQLVCIQSLWCSPPPHII